MVQNFYEMLGIANTASQDEVRKAYKKRALETHPDKLVPSSSTVGIAEIAETAAARFRSVHEAFQVLNDPYQRRAYDLRIRPRADSTTNSKSWFQLNEEQIARMKDRAEWVRQATQRRKERISALNEARKAREASWTVQQEPKSFGYQAMVDQMLEDLCKMNPEWRIRKEEALRRKAEREKASATGR